MANKEQNCKIHFRHEWKHEINISDMICLRQRLSAVAFPDPHAMDGKYEIRSLYFDNLSDKALRKKLDGVKNREKFRLRYYNGDTSSIFLEKKSKINNLSNKETAMISEKTAKAILSGNMSTENLFNEIDNPPSDGSLPLIAELYEKMKSQGLRPKTIVDYTREPYVFPAGNVRITIDYNIRTGLFYTNFLDYDCPTIPIADSPIILEVKWDEWLPDIIRDAVRLSGRRSSAFSKYAACRMYD